MLSIIPSSDTDIDKPMFRKLCHRLFRQKSSLPPKYQSKHSALKVGLILMKISLSGLAIYTVVILGSPQVDDDRLPITDEFSSHSLLKQYILRSWREIGYYKKLLQPPSKEKLLPDPLHFPYNQPKYTLVLELNHVLVNSDSSGLRFQKRPLLDHFLESLKDQYEIVIYTADDGMTVYPLVDKLDPKNCVAFKLVRDATYLNRGYYVKTLNNLNRDLSKVVCVDWNSKSCMFNPDNLFCIKKWTGNDDDTSLLDLTTFLKAIADNNVEDVREVLKVYQKYDDPVLAIRETQKRLIDELEKQAAVKKSEEKKRKWKTPSVFKSTNL